MSAVSIERPVWRRFRTRWLARAAAWVRAGGHAAILDERGDVSVLLSVNERGTLPELSLWALLSIDQRRWRRVKDGPAEGLAKARIKPQYLRAVLDWCERDSMHEDPTRVLELDCVACAACCHDADVVLEERDLERFRSAGRRDLAGRAYVRRAKDGRVTLRLSESGRCKLLGPDKHCTIYEIRPDNCRAFVTGSEACLSARDETLGIRDGVRDA